MKNQQGDERDDGLRGNDPIQVLELGRKYFKNRGRFDPAEGMSRAIDRALHLLVALENKGPGTETNADSIRKLTPNTGILEDIRCPKCSSYEPFYINFGARLVYDQATQNTYVWDMESGIVCVECQHKGVVGEFKPHVTDEKMTFVEDRGEDLPVYPTAPETSSPTVAIQAEAHSDDQAVRIKFDALAWFRESSAENILALANCGWGGDYPADAVVLHTQDGEQEKRLFSYLTIHPKMGFECHVNEDNAMAWLADNRPEVHDLLQRACS